MERPEPVGRMCWRREKTSAQKLGFEAGRHPVKQAALLLEAEETGKVSLEPERPAQWPPCPTPGKVLREEAAQWEMLWKGGGSWLGRGHLKGASSGGHRHAGLPSGWSLYAPL